MTDCLADSSILDLKAFVPAKEPSVSRQFYCDLGFKQNWANDQIAEFQIGSFRFLLQNYHAKGYAENYMISLTVADVEAWWRQIEAAKLKEKYPGIMAKAPAMQPWGLKVLFLSDPGGVLWHFVERPKG